MLNKKLNFIHKIKKRLFINKAIILSQYNLKILKREQKKQKQKNCNYR